jgi:hypothetical protein
VVDAQETQSVALQAALNGGVVNNAQLALRIAELLCANAYGEDSLERQKPLSVSDLTDRWVITGSYNKGSSREGEGPLVISIMKRDGQVLEPYQNKIMFPPAEVKEMLRKPR